MVFRLAATQPVTRSPGRMVSPSNAWFSSPLAALPSQSAKPALHVNPHALAAHVAVACAGVGQR